MMDRDGPMDDESSQVAVGEHCSDYEKTEAGTGGRGRDFGQKIREFGILPYNL
jgi:hypothetical protein